MMTNQTDPQAIVPSMSAIRIMDAICGATL